MSLRDKFGFDRKPKPRPQAAPLPKLPQNYSKPLAPAKPQTPIKQVVSYSCGHEESVKNFVGRPCPACLLKIKEERRKRKQEKNQRVPTEVGWRTKASQYLERLPDGATYTGLIYSAKTKTWTGALLIPTINGEDGYQKFVGEESAVYKLLSLLDTKYREWSKNVQNQTRSD